MGELITKCLDARDSDRGFDPLVYWMVQEIAAAMAAVEKARSEAARRKAVEAASDLILKVWQERSSWPSGWPPESIARRVACIERTRPRRAPLKPSGSPWADRLTELESLWLREASLWWKMGLLEIGADDAKALVGLLPDVDGAEQDSDIEIVNFELDLLSEALQEASEAGTRSIASRRDQANKELRKISAERRKLLKEVLAQRPRPKKRRRRSTK